MHNCLYYQIKDGQECNIVKNFLITKNFAYILPHNLNNQFMQQQKKNRDKHLIYTNGI